MRGRPLGCAATLGVVGLLLAFIGLVVPLDAAFALAFGWLRHSWRLASQVRLEPIQLGTFLVLTFIAVGLFRRLMMTEGPPPTEAPDHPETRSAPRLPAGFAWRAVALCLVAFTAGIAMVGVAHQSAWLAVSPEPWTENRFSLSVAGSISGRHLHTIAHGVSLHEDEFQKLPGAGVYSADGDALHSWMTRLLPYVGHPELYRRIDVGRSWRDPVNADPLSQTVEEFGYPERERIVLPESIEGRGIATYAGNVRVLGPNGCETSREVKDGLAQTLFLGEIRENFRAWGDPSNLRDPALGVNRSPVGFGAPWSYGTQFVMGDGSVRRISDRVPPEVLLQLATPNAGDGGSELLDPF